MFGSGGPGRASSGVEGSRSSRRWFQPVQTGFTAFICESYSIFVVQVDLAGPVQEWKDLAPVDDGSNQYLGTQHLLFCILG